MAPLPLISLHIVGEARIVVAHATRTAVLTPASDRLFTLALLLAADPGRPTPRARLTAWLWPDLPPSAARHALRQLLYRLRRLGVPVDGDPDHLSIDPRAVAPPDEPTLTCSAHALPRTGRCLPGWDPPGTALRAWLDGYRATVESRARTALAHALDDAVARAREPAPEQPRDPRYDRTALAAALLELDPQHPLARATIPRPRVVRESPRAYPAPCIGRDPLLRALHARLAAAREGVGGVAVLAAPPRTGATRVLEELAHGARALGLAVAHVADELPTPRAFVYRLATTLRHLLERPGALGCGPHALRTVRQFTVSQMLPTGAATIRRLGAAIAELARSLSGERPLLVVVDAPCATPVERALVSAIARTITDATALAVFVAHPTTGHTLRGVAHVVALHSLDADAADTLATTTARTFGASLTDDDRAWCTTMARGRPGDVIALARACARHPGTRALPPTIAAHLHDCVGTLPPRTRQVAALCALIGDTDTADRAAHALGRRPAAIQAALYELRRADVPGITVAGEPRVVQREITRIIGITALATFEPGERAVLRAQAASVRERASR